MVVLFCERNSWTSFTQWQNFSLVFCSFYGFMVSVSPDKYDQHFGHWAQMCTFIRHLTLKRLEQNTLCTYFKLCLKNKVTGCLKKKQDQSVSHSFVKEWLMCHGWVVLALPWDSSSPLKRVSGVSSSRVESGDSLQLWGCVITHWWHPGR